MNDARAEVMAAYMRHNTDQAVGTPPSINGLPCDAFICEAYHYKGELVATANVTYASFGGSWHRLSIDAGVVFWGSLQGLEPDEPPEMDDWSYPRTDVAALANVNGEILTGFQLSRGPDRVSIHYGFQSGRSVVIESIGEDGPTNFRLEI